MIQYYPFNSCWTYQLKSPETLSERFEFMMTWTCARDDDDDDEDKHENDEHDDE